MLRKFKIVWVESETMDIGYIYAKDKLDVKEILRENDT